MRRNRDVSASGGGWGRLSDDDPEHQRLGQTAMPINFSTEQGAFDPEATAAMGEAFDAACKDLHRTTQPEVVRELIATLIIAAASQGELDPVRLRMVAVAGVRDTWPSRPSHFRSAESEWKGRGCARSPRSGSFGFGQPSSAVRPASVILIWTTSITAQPGSVTTSRCAVARPSWTRAAIMARSNPWARPSRSSVMPCGKLASSASAWRCSLPRLGSRGGTAIRAELTESFAADGYLGDLRYKRRALINRKTPFSSRRRASRGDATR